MTRHALVLIGLLTAAPTDAAEKLLVQQPAVYEEKAEVPPAIFHECSVEEHVGLEVLRRVSEAIPGAEPLQKPAEPGDVKHLTLTIVEVRGYGGGSWSGAKRIALRADVRQNGGSSPAACSRAARAAARSAR